MKNAILQNCVTFSETALLSLHLPFPANKRAFALYSGGGSGGVSSSGIGGAGSGSGSGSYGV